MDKYDPAKIESKWQKVWEEQDLYKTPEPTPKHPKKYILDMFPYPSGAVLHVGHMEGYVGTDVVSRYYRMKGFSVLHPMGWDAFGLPAENYAVKTGIHPDKSTHDNIDTFRRQLKMLGLSYDWSRELDTSSPNYYKWTQWLFIRLFKMGLAYKAKAAANWCPSCETVLANEQVENGKCERCGSEVTQKELDQWFLKITAYADKLIEGLDRINWPQATKLMQKNWIGKKHGAKIKFDDVEVFTTRPDTLYGATFLVLSPGHPLARLASEAKRAGKVKTAVNPATKKEIPIFVDEYVLDIVGTGAIMGVPAHDGRDFEFAKKHNLPIVRVVKGPDDNGGPIEQLSQVFDGEGILINSGPYDGLKSTEAFEKIMKDLEKRGLASFAVTYHLRDWLISRQRYWGAPIPTVYCQKDGWQPVPDTDLPVMLPTDVDFRPRGESPIGRSASFRQGVKCPRCSGPARREIDTMDTFVDSSWYFIRFVDSKNNKEFASKKEIRKWLPVDIYVGGGHTVQHLLFARFFQKALADAGLIPAHMDEPFLELKVPGWILGPDSRKMSKRWNNVITPDEVVKQYGADTMRMYEMFMAPFEVDKPWNINSVAGVYRFIHRIYNLFEKNRVNQISKTNKAMIVVLNKLVNKMGQDISQFKFNTAVSAMMEFANAWEKSEGLSKEDLSTFVRTMAPFAPHLTEELWHRLGKGDSIHLQAWPKVKGETVTSQTSTIIISIDGKKRASLEISKEEERALGEKGIAAMAQKEETVTKYLAGKEIKRVVYRPGKVVNFVIGKG